MRAWTSRAVAVLVIAVGSIGLGQAPTQPTPIQPVAARGEAARPAVDVRKLSPLQQQLCLAAQRGADWLRRANGADGRFAPGHVPALKANLEHDHYLRQARAAWCLARAARFFADERLAAVARQAVLTLLLETSPDPADAQVRSTTVPSLVVNRLGAAAILTLAIHELPAPGDDLLAQAEGLCHFIRKQQKADGSLGYGDAVEGVPAVVDPEGVNHYPGQALYALLVSMRHRPAAWKLDVVRKALPYYRAWWRDHPQPTFAAWHLMACAEAHALTQEKPFAEFAAELGDWLCGLQHVQLDPRHPLWVGGFMEWAQDKPVPTAPHVGSALLAEGLVGACAVARRTADLPRYQRSREAVERCLQFLVTLQYTDANTQHFADWYRPTLLGGFHASHQDGNLRLDYTQQAVNVLLHYLAQGEPHPGR
jgi:hypothetical protein